MAVINPSDDTNEEEGHFGLETRKSNYNEKTSSINNRQLKILTLNKIRKQTKDHLLLENLK